MASLPLQELFPRDGSPAAVVSCVCAFAWSATYPAQLMHSSTIAYEHAGIYFAVTLIELVVLAGLFGAARLRVRPVVAAACGVLAAVVGIGAVFGLFTWVATYLLAALLIAQFAAFLVVFGAAERVQNQGHRRGLALAAGGLVLASVVHFIVNVPLSNAVGASGNFGVYSQVAAVTGWLLVAASGIALAVSGGASGMHGTVESRASADAKQAVDDGLAGFSQGPQVSLLIALVVVVCAMACIVCTLGGFLATPYYLEPFVLADGVSLGHGLVGAALLAAAYLLPVRDMQLFGLSTGLAMLLALVGVILCVIARNVQMTLSVLLYTSFGAFAAVLCAVALSAWRTARVRASMVVVAVQLFALFCSQFGGLAVKQAIGVDSESIALVIFVMVAALLVVFLGVSLVLNVLSQRALVQASQDMARSQRALREIESAASSIGHASEVIDEKNRRFLAQFDLTERQRDYAVLLLRGLTYDQISEIEGVQVTTVRYHASNIYKKIDVTSKGALRQLADDWNAQN